MRLETNPFLKIENLEVVFTNKGKKNIVLNRVNFEIPKGKVLGLVGESGCGKSMTALSIMKLLPPEISAPSGKIFFNDMNILELSSRDMRQIRGKRIAMIFQDPHSVFNPVRSIGRQFIETLQYRMSLSKKEALAVASQSLLEMGLADSQKILSCYPFQLSGGMKQRVMIAMALAMKPDFLIADEPTTALDVTIQAQILIEIEKLKEKYNTGVLLISHNFGVIAQLSDWVCVMYAGEIIEYGLVKEIFYKASHPYTKGLLCSIPDFANNINSLQQILGQPPEIYEERKGCSFYPRCAYRKEFCENNQPLMEKINSNHFVSCFFPI
ncbi:ABC transporter ATP-binding protein [Clostridium formicaceticum]|uniref:Oligopeptide transport ATP-binding protein OppD n=1 Tax=Clostridium formicaceticum TaxID=1497 RepID=A0AAC9RPA0_9CLOT|nr:ABC transporter ATP-binding protein [Clostridium formicaceticum]AOY74486.1 hypothetical protein BJL90_00060 [Clostridium formicaceticum]ARE88833.1 Oligopeptide transport ATP-binding protein OppD [Clostridium formicaceticum]